MDVNARHGERGLTPLHAACGNKHEAVIRLLLASPEVDPRRPDLTGATPLHLAVTSGAEQTVAALLKRRVDLTATDHCDRTPLHVAIENHHGDEALAANLVRALCAAKAPLGPTRRGALTPLELAVLHTTDGSLLHALIDYGADISTPNTAGVTPCYQALSTKRLLALETLLKRGASLQLPGPYNKTRLTCVHLAGILGDLDVIQSLMNCRGPTHDEEIAMCDANGRSLLHYAAALGHTDLLRFFWEARQQKKPYGHLLDLNAADHFGLTPLAVSLICGHGATAIALMTEAHVAADTVDRVGNTIASLATLYMDGAFVTRTLLATGGAALNMSNLMGRSPLHEAARADNVEALGELAKLGAEGHVTDVEGHLPLHDAIAVGSTRGMQACWQLAARAGVNPVRVLDRAGRTLVHHAVVHGQVETLLALVDEQGCGKLLNVADLDRRSPLATASSQGNVEMVAWLLAVGGVALEARDGEGYTPLHLAARAGHEAVCDLLWTHGAFVRATDARGWAPLHHAAHAGHAGCVSILLRDAQPSFCPPDDDAHRARDYLMMNGKPPSRHHSRRGSRGGGSFDAFDTVGGSDRLEAALSVASAQLLSGSRDSGGHGRGSYLVERVVRRRAEGNMGRDLEEVVERVPVVGLAVEVDMATGDGKATALHMAAMMGHTETCVLLLKAGASMAAENSEGQTLAAMLVARGNKAFAQLLEGVHAAIHAAGEKEAGSAFANSKAVREDRDDDGSRNGD